MGKVGKLKRRQKKMLEKRKEKQANAAEYQRRKIAGQNTKSKRARLSNKKNKKSNTIDHIDSICGNLACNRCHSGFPPFKIAVTIKIEEKPKSKNSKKIPKTKYVIDQKALKKKLRKKKIKKRLRRKNKLAGK